MKKLAAYCVLGALLVSPAASPSFAQATQDASAKTCSSGANAVGGALLGGLVGGLLAGKHDRGKGALIGAAIGGAAGGLSCVAFKSRVERKRSDAEVQQVYRAQLTDARQPTLLAYETELGAPTYTAGEDIVVQSHIVVAGAQSRTDFPIQERFTVVTPDGKRKQFVKEVSDRGGEMTNELTFALPTAMPKGVYNVESELLVDGKEMGSNQSRFRLA